MGEAAGLKIRSDLYPGETSPRSSVPSNLAESEVGEDKTSSNKTQKLPSAPEPIDWKPNEPCFVCQGKSADSKEVNIVVYYLHFFYINLLIITLF